MAVNFERISEHLKNFQFEKLFIEDLGWSSSSRLQPKTITHEGIDYVCRPIAHLAGVPVLEIRPSTGAIPPGPVRRQFHKQISRIWHEHLLIFIDRRESQCIWYWVYREGTKVHPRDHLYVRGQPGDLFLSKLGRLIFELKDFEKTGDVSVIEVAKRLRDALDVQRVTKKFFLEFQEHHLSFLEHIRGIKDERQKRWYASVILNRLMFIYFLQKKRFLDGGNLNYLRDKLSMIQRQGKDRFFQEFLKILFFEGFAKPTAKRSAAAQKVLGDIRYLNGGLFLPHPIEQENPRLDIPDVAFVNLFNLFESYSWNLNDTPGASDNEINPDVLGYIFEKYINQKAFGAYYTCPEITEYLCERTIHRLVLSAVNPPENLSVPVVGLTDKRFESLADLLLGLDAGLCKRLLMDILPGMTLLDPACGSGAFLVAAMKTLVDVYSAVIGRIKFVNNAELSTWLKEVEKEGRSVSYFIKKKIITDNLYGVDIMEEAAEIAKLRLFLTLVASVEKPAQLEPLPNIDFNIQPGNSLIGLLHVQEEEFDSKYGDLFRPKFRELRAEKNRLVNIYRHATVYAEDLVLLRDDIRKQKKSTLGALDEILLEQFASSKIQFEQATWDNKKGKQGKPLKRPLTVTDIQELHPFHWGFEFDQVFEKRGGFDAVITNPPWEVFEAQEKEFFQEYEATIQKKKIRIEDWVEHFQNFMNDPELRSAWLTFSSSYPHVAKYFKLSDQYPNQSSTIDGDIVASKINLCKCFCIAMITARADFRATCNWVPSSISPFDGRMFTHLVPFKSYMEFQNRPFGNCVFALPRKSHNF